MTEESRKFAWGPQSYSIDGILDWPGSWAFVGLILGLALAVSIASAWLITLAFIGYLVNLNRHKTVGKDEGWLFSTGPALMMAWILGFVIRGIVS